MFEWILANLEKVIPVIVVLLWLFGGRKNEEQAEPERPVSTSQPRYAPPEEPVSEEDNLRRIQEEIRRRIAERQQPQRQAPVAAYEPPPLPAQQTTAPVQASATERLDDANYGRIEDAAAAPDDMSDVGVYNDAPAVTAIASMEDRLRELEKYRLDMEQATHATVDASLRAAMLPVPAGQQSGMRLRGSIVSMLRDPTGLRDAIVLREILGPPPGLR